MLVMVIRAPSVSTHDEGTAGLAIGAAIGGLAGVAAGYVPVFKGRAEQRRAELKQAEARQAAAHAMDRLPPGPADREEVALYLATLIRWLNTDPWPRDTGFAGPVLTPAEDWPTCFHLATWRPVGFACCPVLTRPRT
jgi:hypothetical protein